MKHIKTRTLGLIICAIGFAWMSTTIIATETASAKYITQILQENQASGIPRGYSHTAAFQNTVDRLIDISRNR